MVFNHVPKSLGSGFFPKAKKPTVYTVIDGDEDDVRFNDPKGIVIGLKAKGLARKDTSGFVV